MEDGGKAITYPNAKKHEGDISHYNMMMKETTTDRQTDRQTDRKTDRQKDRQTGIISAPPFGPRRSMKAEYGTNITAV